MLPNKLLSEKEVLPDVPLGRRRKPLAGVEELAEAVIAILSPAVHHSFPRLPDRKQRLDGVSLSRDDRDCLSNEEPMTGMSSSQTSANLERGSSEERKPPMRTTFIPEPLLDSEQAAAIMQIHPKTLQKLARKGDVRGLHVGKLWRFRASDISQWIDEQIAS
jgi:excisionase family DNA binding protein